MIDAIGTEAANDALGRVLFMKMEALDPSGYANFYAPDYGWSDLPDHSRSFYRLSAMAVVIAASQFQSKKP